jgi:signal transduction histidine kinase
MMGVMESMLVSNRPSFDPVRIALKSRDLSVLEGMLRDMADRCGGSGVVLWQERKHQGKDCLFVVAHGFKDSRTVCAFDSLPLDTATGRTISEGEVEVDDCADDPRIARDNDFYRRELPGSLLSLGIRFHGGMRGAITIYRKEKGLLPEPGKALFREYATLVPDLYETILDRVSYDLVEQVSRTLDFAEYDTEGSPEATLKRVCESIGKSLCAFEVSVFLEDPTQRPNVIVCKATTCHALLRQEEYHRDDDGFTPYVWRSAEVLRVFDVPRADQELRDKTRWRDAMGIEAKVRDELKLEKDDATPPISFAAVPVKIADKVLGVVRCHLRPRTPYHFSVREVELLEILASRIAFFWTRRLRTIEAKQSRESWLKFVDSLNGLNLEMKQLGTASLDAIKHALYRDGLQSLKNAVSGLDIVDVALVDRDRNLISTAAIVGSSKILNLPVSPATANAWARVLSDGEIYWEADVSSPKGPYKEFYAGVRQAIFVPIVAGAERVGIVSLRSFGVIRDPNQAMRLGQLLALVVSLYELLAMLMSAQSRMYQELEHQLRTPVFQVRKRAVALLSGIGKEVSPDVEYDVQALNGLIAKAYRVLSNMRIFENLALSQKITPSGVMVSIESILRTLGQACADHRILWRDKGLVFSYDGNMFAKVKVKALKVDLALFEQIINNVLDNSAKYSAPQSTVTMDTFVESDNPTNRRLVLVVKNVAGVRLTSSDVQHLGERGFRSPNATKRTTDGSGLGLYIVRNIMAAHGGELRAMPTDPVDTTRIELVFPLED